MPETGTPFRFDRELLAFKFCCAILGFILLFLLGAESPSVAQDSAWPVQQIVGPFHFHSDSSLADVGNLAEDMSKLQQDLGTKLGLSCSVKKIHVVLLRSEADYNRYIHHYFPQLPARRALFIKDRGPGIVFAYRHSELLVDLRHECTHALLQNDLPKIPLWLDEGLAEYFESYGEQGSYHTTHVPITQWQTKLGHAPALEELERCCTPDQMDARRYSDAWAWVHFLLEYNENGRNANGRKILQGYLQDLAANGDTAGELSTRIKRSMPNWRSEFLNHFQTLQPPSSKAEDRFASVTTEPSSRR